ncbi:hypothetical protein GCM10025868_12620 [Angustibacter aerolatus]|uniref:Zinc-finger domain-containing protein n=1 Tax=Angustibacter aerolatus TaxID=1162965 RepID=A0ABQ6JGG7_9ACTN|nr:hypothetical protein GCM10025868_12620 [Angustibacter aerolatus]
MIQRVSSHSPCLGERVAALADGSMNPDAATRAVAHVAHCARCREALELERLTIERLRALPDPQPSGDLMASLLSLGGPGGPVPVRHGRVPGTPRQPTTSVAPPGGYPQGWPGPSAPGGSRRPGARRGVGRRAFVTAAAGALGAGAVVVGLAGPLTASTPGTGRVQPPTAQAGAGRPLQRRPPLRPGGHDPAGAVGAVALSVPGVAVVTLAGGVARRVGGLRPAHRALRVVRPTGRRVRRCARMPA